MNGIGWITVAEAARLCGTDELRITLWMNGNHIAYARFDGILMIDGASEAGHKLSRGTSGNILPSTALERKWQDYKYVKPIPTTARQENPNLTQNPKW